MRPLEKVTYWRDPQIQGVEICEVKETRHVFPDHAHDGIYALGLMEAGGSYCLGRDKPGSLVSQGQMALINPNQVHSGVPLPSKQVSYRMVYLDARLVETATTEIVQQPPGIPEFSCTVVEDPLLWRSLQRLCRIIQGPGGRLEKESAVMDAIVHLAPFYGRVPARGRAVRGSRKSIRQAKALLAENLERKISLAEVARAAGVSHYHFLRVFKQATGLPPHLYRNLRRIERAKQLLRRGQPLADIALTVGFSDQSHLTNTFRKYTGATPGQYATKSYGQCSSYESCSAKQ